jgi:hypothetical protein
MFVQTQFEPMVEQTIVHYAADGWLLHKSADDARRQMDMDKMEHEAASKYQSEVGQGLCRIRVWVCVWGYGLPGVNVFEGCEWGGVWVWLCRRWPS